MRLIYFRDSGDVGIGDLIQPRKAHLQRKEAVHIVEARFEEDLEDVFLSGFFGDVLDPFLVLVHHAQDLVTTKLLTGIQQGEIGIHLVLKLAETGGRLRAFYLWLSLFFRHLALAAGGTELRLFRDGLAAI